MSHRVRKANAGVDLRICAGTGAPIGETATGGTPPFTYAWSPSFGLDNPASMKSRCESQPDHGIYRHGDGRARLHRHRRGQSLCLPAAPAVAAAGNDHLPRSRPRIELRVTRRHGTLPLRLDAARRDQRRQRRRSRCESDTDHDVHRDRDRRQRLPRQARTSL
jgi:hypothetical protein